MKKNTMMKASAILATVLMTATANATMASAKEITPRTVKRSKKNDVVSVETIELSDTQAVAGKMWSWKELSSRRRCHAGSPDETAAD